MPTITYAGQACALADGETVLDALRSLDKHGVGGGNHSVIAADGRQMPWPSGTFDRVLADVPCSGLGSLRRRPEAGWPPSRGL